jgi:hypothetical protein
MSRILTAGRRRQQAIGAPQNLAPSSPPSNSPSKLQSKPQGGLFEAVADLVASDAKLCLQAGHRQAALSYQRAFRTHRAKEACHAAQ